MIEVDVLKCTGCRICQLICSFTHYKLFSTDKSHIKIIEEYGLTPQIQFSEECNLCGRCSTYCLYGALKIKEMTKS